MPYTGSCRGISEVAACSSRGDAHLCALFRRPLEPFPVREGAVHVPCLCSRRVAAIQTFPAVLPVAARSDRRTLHAIAAGQISFSIRQPPCLRELFIYRMVRFQTGQAVCPWGVATNRAPQYLAVVRPGLALCNFNGCRPRLHCWAGDAAASRGRVRADAAVRPPHGRAPRLNARLDQARSRTRRPHHAALAHAAT